MWKYTYNVTSSKKHNEIFEIDQEIVINDLWHLLLGLVILLGVDLLWFTGALKSSFASRLLLFNFGSHMENFIDDFQKVIGAPLLVISHNIIKDAVHLLNDVHLHQFWKLNLPWLDDSSNNFNGKRIKFGMIYLKVLEYNFN